MRRAPAIAAPALIVAFMLAGCQTLSSALPFGAKDDAVVVAMPGQVEPLHAAAFTNDLAVFWVSSNGCTTKEDLRPIVRMHGGDAVITLRRIEEDPCDDPVSDGVELQWSFEELGLPAGSAVSVNNPYQLPSSIGPAS